MISNSPLWKFGDTSELDDKVLKVLEACIFSIPAEVFGIMTAVFPSFMAGDRPNLDLRLLLVPATLSDMGWSA